MVIQMGASTFATYTTWALKMTAALVGTSNDSCTAQEANKSYILFMYFQPFAAPKWPKKSIMQL